ncbi:MAG TPA: 3-keto-5-aminohexanoate cleavage protein [Gemmatimonadales bacterium]|nr:3-keto-5-aminohexanoate cleavage protein [Gemmatimonadales bacterium]
MDLLLEAALNGGRSPADHPAMPVTPTQLSAAAAESARAGARAVHFHVRGGDGRESLAAADVARAVAEVRTQGVPFGISTGAWIISDPVRRLAIVAEWTVLPDFVSINFDEEGAAELASSFLQRNVAIEAGVANPFAAEQLVRSGLADRCLRIMFEPREQVVADAMTAVAATEAVLDAAAVRAPRLLHGVNATAWPLLDAARARGYATRIGFEDTLTLPGGEVAGGNGELVRAALTRLAGGTTAANPLSS